MNSRKRRKKSRNCVKWGVLSQILMPAEALNFMFLQQNCEI